MHAKSDGGVIGLSLRRSLLCMYGQIFNVIRHMARIGY